MFQVLIWNPRCVIPRYLYSFTRMLGRQLLCYRTSTSRVMFVTRENRCCRCCLTLWDSTRLRAGMGGWRPPVMLIEPLVYLFSTFFKLWTFTSYLETMICNT
jgi:hypothetical protein